MSREENSREEIEIDREVSGPADAPREASKISLYLSGMTFALTVGFAFFGIKQCVPYADTLVLLAYRYAAALLGVILFVAITRLIRGPQRREPGRPKAKLYMNAAFYMLFMIFQILSMYFATSIEGAIVFAMVPIFAKIIGRIILGERATWLQNFFVVITVAALIVLIVLNATDIHLSVMGLLIMTIGSIFMSCQNVSARYIRGVFSPIEITTCISVGGFIIFFGTAFARALITGDMAGLIEPLTHPRFVIWASFLGIFCILLSAQFMSYMLAHMQIVQCTVFSSASTLVSIIAGVMILGEPLNWYHYICGGLILAGVIGLSAVPADEANSGKSLRDDMEK